MSILPSPLLRRRYLLPGESLPSLLIRLGKVNHYVPLSLVLGLAFAQTEEKGYYTDISRALSPMILGRLAALTKLDPLTLYSSTYHPFATIVTPPEIAIGPLTLANDTLVPVFTGRIAQFQLRSEFAAQFCPECLRNSIYHRLIWVPIAVAACLHHKRLLVNRCPQCCKLVKVKEIIETYCSKCKTSLMEAQSLQIQNDEFGLFSQHVIQSWFVEGCVYRSEEYLLPEQPVRALYRFIDGLRMALMQVTLDWSYLHHLLFKMESTASTKVMKPQSLSPHQSYCLYATALKSIINWPEGFYEFLDSYRTITNKNKPIGHAVGYDLGLIYYWLEKNLQHPSFAFVQKAFDHYFLDRYGLSHEIIKSGRYRTNQQLVQQLSYISLSEAAHILGTDAEMIKFLVHIGRLTQYNSNDTYQYIRLSRTEVTRLQSKWRALIGLAETAQLLGISQSIVLNMVEAGLLVAECSPVEGFAHWKFCKSMVTECFDKIVRHVKQLVPDQLQDSAEQLLPLSLAVMTLSAKSGLETTYLLLQIIQGRLPAYHPSGHKIQFRNLLFYRADIEICTTRLKINNWVKPEVPKLRHNNSSSIGLSSTARLLGISEQVVLNMVKIGLLVAECSPTEGSYQWIFSKSAIVACFNRVIEHVKINQIRDNGISPLLRLFPATRIFNAKSGLNAAYLLLQVVQGHLPAYHPEGQEIQFRNLLFNRSDIDKCIAAFEAENNLVKRRDAQAILGVADSTLARWVKRGLVPTATSTCKRIQYFDRRILDNFLDLHIKTKEAVDVLGISRLAIQALAKAGYLEAISGPTIDGHGIYIFNREKLIQWRSQWLHDEEAMQMLRINNIGILNKYVEQGKIQVLKPPNGHRRWFSKQTIIELLESMKVAK